MNQKLYPEFSNDQLFEYLFEESHCGFSRGEAMSALAKREGVDFYVIDKRFEEEWDRRHPDSD